MHDNFGVFKRPERRPRLIIVYERCTSFSVIFIGFFMVMYTLVYYKAHPKGLFTNKNQISTKSYTNDELSTRYKTLTQIYGKYFMMSEIIISKAIQDERLRNAVKDILETQPNSPSIENPEQNDVFEFKSATIKLYSQMKSIFKFSTKDTSSMNTNNLTLRSQAEKMNAQVDETDVKLKEKFTELIGDNPRSYVLKKRSSFDLKGNLNLWDYFVHESRNQNLLTLRRNMKLETGVDGHYVFTMADIHPVRISADGNYLLYDELIDGPMFKAVSRRHSVTVTTQLSIDRLHSYVESYVYWYGPISLAVLLNGPMEYFLLRSYLSFVKRCYPLQFERTRFNIVTPIDDPIPRDVFIQTRDFDDTSCHKSSGDINEILKKKITKSTKWLKTKWYPQNLMRNVARKNILTDYQITLDVDIMPCDKMSEGLNKLLNGSVYTNALVVPTYEVSRKAHFPLTKSDLVSLTKKGMAQPFHKNVYLPNQNATNFPKWEKVHDSYEDVHVIHEVSQFPLHYEPFFVELNSNPMYDEGFVGYGFTRSSHAYEVFLKSGNFMILSPIFTVQLGIQKTKQWSTSRQEQNEHNRDQFEILIRKLMTQYNFTTEKQSRS